MKKQAILNKPRQNSHGTHVIYEVIVFKQRGMKLLHKYHTESMLTNYQRSQCEPCGVHIVVHIIIFLFLLVSTTSQLHARSSISQPGPSIRHFDVLYVNCFTSFTSQDVSMPEYSTNTLFQCQSITLYNTLYIIYRNLLTQDSCNSCSDCIHTQLHKS